MPVRNLLGRLHDRSPHELDLIARWWEVTPRGRDHHAIAGQLYRVLIDSWAFALAWERLSPTDRVLLDLLIEDEGAYPLAAIAERLNAPLEAVLPSVRRLYRAGYLFVEQDELELPTEAERRFFLPRETAGLTARLRQEETRGLPLAADAAELLDRLPDGALADLAEELGYQVIPALALRPELVAYLTPRLGDPEIVASSIAALRGDAARLWASLHEQAEPPSPAEAKEALALSGGALREAIRQLGRRGLLWRGYVDGALRLAVPELVRHPRRADAPPLPALVTVSDETAEPVDWLPDDAAAWDLLTLLRTLAAGARELDDGHAQRRLAPSLWRRSGDVPPTGYVPFLLSLATGLGLADARGLDRQRARDWTRLDFPEQTRRLVACWRAASDWPEGAGRETLQVWGADWPGFRRRLLDALGALTPGAWLTVGSFTARFAAGAPNALGGSFTAAGAAELEHEEATPEQRRRAVVRLAAEATLVTAAAWLGLVQVSRARREAVFTLTPLGAALLDADAERPPAELLGERPLAVQPNFEVLLLQPAPRRLWVLSAFAEVIALDRASRYRLTRQSIERGLAAGVSLAQITAFLERQSGEALPQNVAFELASWAKAFRRVRLSRALLLEPDDRASAAAIADALRRDGLRVELLVGSRLLVGLPDGVAEAELSKIEERLRELGHTPLLGLGNHTAR
ncbi:MAG TPA: helicase-associated domain-containing protein [Thermomicrobiaceae bacterium]|nr:helicase-associated domain-containing protein [Thermomicrobiaceae bacterium]